MSTDISIKAYQAYLNNIPIESATETTSSWEIQITDTSWYAQIFKADAALINNIFFFANISESDTQGNSISLDDNLKIQIWSVTDVGDNVNFTLNSCLEEYSVFEEINSEDFGKWYKLDNLPSFTEDGYFAIVFKSQVSSESGGAPKIFYTDSYRQDIFPIIYASDDEGESWSNSIVETRSAGRSNLGAICLGYVGKEVDETTSFDSGDITVGGFFSSKRGYPVYLYVENESSQTIKSIYVDFSMLPPSLSSDGTGDETNQAMMRWYYYQPATLPTSKDIELLNKTIGKKPILDQTASFVIFTQPDRLPPYPKAFFEENEMSLESNVLGFTTIYNPESDTKSYDVSITDTTNDFSDEKWAHFFNPNNNANVNPSYIDFTLEKGGEEVSTLARLSMDNEYEQQTIRGFNNVVKYRNYYIAFAKYNTEYYDTVGGGDWWEDSVNGYDAPDGLNDNIVIYYAHEDNINTWTRTTMDVADTAAITGLSGKTILGNRTSKIIGIHDAIVKNTGSDKTETLFVILQVYPEDGDTDPSVPYFVPAYTMDGIGTAMTFTCLEAEEVHPNDGRFTPRRNHATKNLNVYPSVYPNVDPDHKSARFISPNNNSNKIYVTARNQCLENTAQENKFGLWEINLEENIISSTQLSRIKTSNYSSSVTQLVGRGFDPEYTEEVEISYIYKDVGRTYFGTNNSNESVLLGHEKMGQVYSTDDFSYFTQIISGETYDIESQQWLNSYSFGSTDYNYLDAITFSKTDKVTYAYDFVVNGKVSFITKVGDILHVWLTPNNHTLLGTPFHVAYKISTNETKILRKFPISSNEFNETFTVKNAADISDLKTQDMSKSLRTIDGGIVNGNKIFIYGRDGYGQSITYLVDSNNPDGIVASSIVQEAAAETALITIDSGDASVIPTGNNDDFTFVKINNSVNFNTGPYRVVGIIGTDGVVIEMISNEAGVSESTSGMTVEFLKDHYDEETQGTRWLMYDSRIINKAFDYYRDENHNVLESYNSYYPYLYDDYGIYSEKSIPDVGLTEDFNIMGVYDGTTIEEYDYYSGSYIYKQYPVTNVSENNKRIGSYINIIADVPSYKESSKMVSTEDTFVKVSSYFGLYNNYSIDNVLYNRNVKMVNQNGVTYMICDNNNSTDGGMRIYKTYGIKQIAEEWGLKLSDGLSINVDIDQPSYYCVVKGSEFKMSGPNVDVSKVGNMTFISQMKREPIVIGENSLFRNIFALTNGIDLPQFFSYYYQTNYTVVPDSTEDNELVLKWANSWEDLYSAPPSRQLTMVLGEDEVNVEDPTRVIYKNYDFPTDMGYGFYRLESRKIRSDGVNSAEIKVKGLRFFDVNVEGASGTSRTKKIAVSGIVYSGSQDEIEGSFVTSPENIIDAESGGVYLAPSGEIIISFPKEIYINEISFDTNYLGSISGSAAQSALSVFSLPRFGQRTYGDNAIGQSDWDIIGSPMVINSSKENTVTLDRIGRFTRSIKISLNSGVVLKINNLKIKSIGEDEITDNQFVVSSGEGSVSNPELIVIDDTEGLISGTNSLSASAFASFNKAGASLEIDLGVPSGSIKGFPINKISMNVYGAESTRTIAVDVWDGETYDTEGERYWENIYTNYALNYKYTFVNWTPEKKSESRNVNIDVIDSENIGNLSGILTENNSVISDWDQLSLYQFRPNIKRDRGLTIISSSAGVDHDGMITVNTQMDEDGPFSDDIGSTGIIERILNVDFPIKQIRGVKIKVLDSGSSNIRINGFKVYTPIIDSDGLPVWPKSSVTWDIKLQAIANK